MVSWNLRSLRDTTTFAAKGKRACLRSWLQKGSIILLQETHWSDADKAVWEADLLGAQVVHAPATSTARGGSSGGVAIILPSGSRLVSSSVLVPGYAVAATVSWGGAELRLISSYFPPDRQAATLASLRRALEPTARSLLPLIVGGDLNAQWMAPRRGEAELVQDWLTALHSLGVVPLAYAGHSYITDRGGSQIDFLAVTAASAVSLDCRAHWTAFSDHAPLRLSPAHSSGRRDLPITPAMFQTAGTAALADLRRRLRALEGTFGLRRLVATPQLPAFCHPDRPGDCPRGLLPPLHEDCTSPDGCDASAQGAPAQGSAPPR